MPIKKLILYFSIFALFVFAYQNCSDSIALKSAGQNSASSTAVFALPEEAPIYKRVSIGEFHACGVKNKTAYCWGNSEWGQTGVMSTRNNPVIAARQITLQDGTVLSNVLEVGTGWCHSCALTESGQVYCWGTNYWGQLGRNVAYNAVALQAVLIPEITGAKKIYVKNHRTCAILGDRTAYCWGNNGQGELGIGSRTTYFNVPQRVLVSNVKDLALAEWTTCALNYAGQVYCFGDNYNGEIGDGSQNDSINPLLVQDLSRITKIAAGKSHFCALVAEGNIKCWGLNSSGQIGSEEEFNNNFLFPNQKVPVNVLVINNAKNLMLGENTSCATLADGTTKCWGQSAYGEYGGNSSPKPINYAGPSFKEWETKANVTCIVQPDNSIFCKGINIIYVAYDRANTTFSLPGLVLQ